ncbi:MAG TPA: hypothetical protein VGW33_04930 [Terriglobia bacterium]|nr:hypothetical protein [Terriglobia bacterium]
MEPVQICRGFTDNQWEGLRKRLIDNTGTVRRDDAAWECAIKVFERRIKERFISCIDVLEEADPKSDVVSEPNGPSDCSTLPPGSNEKVRVPGFAIMALCCLLIETLQSFREESQGSAKPTGSCTYPKGVCIYPRPESGRELFRKFLGLPPFGGAFDDKKLAGKFVDGIRNGILHEAETRGWLIWRDEPCAKIVGEDGGRLVLNRSLFCDALKKAFGEYLDQLRDKENIELRKRFIKKMDDIAKKC